MTDETDAHEIAITNMIGKKPETLARVIINQDKSFRRVVAQLEDQRALSEYYQKLFTKVSGDYDKACDLLESILAMVEGECPSLLEGHFLYDQIKEVLE